MLAAYPGPVITRFEIEPAVGVKGAQIVNLVKDLARALSVVSIRVVETIPGKSCMALELPNPQRQIVRLVEILSSTTYNDAPGALTLALGKDIAGTAGRRWTSRACRTCWSPARPAPASRSRSTR